MLKTFVALSLASSALAHGVVSFIDIDGGYVGPDPLVSNDSPIWTANINPVTDAYSHDMFCGPSASPNSVATIGAGSTMTIYWEETSYQQWPHNTGPILTYLAACNGDCANMDAGAAHWFKIDQKGFENKQWVQASLMNGGGYQVTIPWDLAAGNYLMRTEVISLHNSYPEYYPRCVSWMVTGGGGNTYSEHAWASFPGTYSPSDAGLAQSGGGIYNVQSTDQYSFPGPNVVTVGQGGSDVTQPAPTQSSANVDAQLSVQANDDSNDNSNVWSAQEDDSEEGDDDYCDDDDEEGEESEGADDSSNPEDISGSNDEPAPQDTSSVQPSSTEQAAAQATQKPDAQPTQQAGAQEQDEQDEQEAQPLTASSASPTPPITATECSEQAANEDECEAKWTQCNKDWVPGTEYPCRDQFMSCRGQSVQKRLAANAKAMRKRMKRDQHHRRHFHH